MCKKLIYLISFVLVLSLTVAGVLGGLTDPPLVNPSFEDPVLDPGARSNDINGWWDALNYTFTQDGALAGYPSNPYGDNWAELGNGRWLYQQIGTYERNMEIKISFLMGQKSGANSVGLTVELFAGGNAELAADVNVKRDAAGFPLDSVVGAVLIASSEQLDPFTSGGVSEAVEMSVELPTGPGGAGYDVGDPLWLVFSRPSVNGRTLIDNVVVSIHGKKATKPDPYDSETDVPRNTDLKWAAPPNYTPSHYEVYFGTEPDESDPNFDMGLIYTGTDTSFDPAKPGTTDPDLDFGTTYYWRVDAFEADGTTIHTGDVWSFTAEPFAYPMPAADITATASSQDNENLGPENTVNGSGLDEAGLLHGKEVDGNMWLSSNIAAQPTWIQYKFDKIFKLHQMWVWNFNGPYIAYFGIKNATIEYSADGTDWTELDGVPEFEKAPAVDDYAHDTTVDFGGVAAKYVRITANSNWSEGITDQCGLSEVRFLYVPVQARKPVPDSGATDVELDLELGWRPGRQADRHDVYLDTSKRDVVKGTAAVTTVTDARYGPLSLDLGDTYYWRVDEVNDAETPSIWQGEVWNFTTQPYFVVDDFEAYDANDNQIWYAWRDGLGFGSQDSPPYNPGNGTGSEVGDGTTASYTEESIVNNGQQAMPYWYNNNKPDKLKYSEAKLTLTSGRDWTRRGVRALTLWFRGYPMSASSFTEAPAGTYTISARSIGNISGESDEFHFAYKVLNGAGSITAKVDWVNDADDNAQAGVMIRNTLDPVAVHATVLLETGDLETEPILRFRRRETAPGGTTSTNVNQIMAPQWLKVSRDMGGSITASYSADGTTWMDLGTGEVIPMDTPMYIGLVVASENINVTCTAQFSNVQITGAAGQWMTQDVGILSNDAEPMYVAVANSNGTTGVVYHDDPAATQIGTWTEWNIDLKGLSDQGVNLSDVNSLAIGFGDRDNPQAGNSGKMYFDDIRLYPSRCIPSVLKPAGDFSNNCVVDMPDLEVMAADWLQSDSVVATTAPNPTGLVVHYKFDGNANDSSGNNHHGIEVAGPTYVAGRFGQAIHLDGFDDYVAIPADFNYTGTDYPEVTVAAWVRTTDDGCIVSFDRSENWRLEVGSQYAGDGLAGWEVWTSGGQMDTVMYAEWPANTGRVDDGKWHHVAGVFDNGTMIIYVDGDPKDPYLLGATFGRGRYTRYGFVGSGSEASYPPPTGRANGPYLEADLDEVRIYDRALSPAEIAYLADETPEDGELYVALQSVGDLYDGEPQGSKAINFRDFSVLIESWLDEQLWPEW